MSEPTRPTAEQMACMEFLVYVGNSSEVYMYTILYENVANISNAINSVKPAHAYPETIQYRLLGDLVISCVPFFSINV